MVLEACVDRWRIASYGRAYPKLQHRLLMKSHLESNRRNQSNSRRAVFGILQHVPPGLNRRISFGRSLSVWRDNLDENGAINLDETRRPSGLMIIAGRDFGKHFD
jgi:hypothetical protein